MAPNKFGLHDFHAGIEGQGNRGQLARRICMGNRPAECSPVADLRMGDMRHHFGDQRESLLDLFA